MNIEQFAAHLKVSTATVSRAFSSKGRISPATRAMILEQARKLGYQPNSQARAMARGRTDTLALFYDAPREADYYVMELTYGITAALAKAGLGLRIHAVTAEQALHAPRLADAVYGGGVDGLIVNLRTPWAEALVAAAERRGLPYVVIDNTREPSANVLSIGAAIEAACIKAGAYFQRLGKQVPGFIHGIHDQRKLAGFREGLGPTLAARLVSDPGGVTFSDAYEAFGRLQRARPGLDALFCANDVLALGAIRAAADQGLRVPGDLAVIGCDDLRLAAFSMPALTTLRLPKFEMGEQAVQMVLSLIRGTVYAPSPLTCELIIRESA